MGRPSRQQRCNGGKPVSAKPLRAEIRLNTKATLGTVLSTRLLTKRYGSLTAVEDLDLEIAAGELFGFLGPNGAGKTTTIKMLVGLLRPTSGSARVAGIDILAEPERAKARIGYVPDAATLYDKLSAREFLEFSADLYHVEPRLRDRRIAALLKLFELDQRGNDFLSGYSRGMRQKVSLAAALLHDPQVLFLDEPTVGLDPQSARQMKDILQDFCNACAPGWPSSTTAGWLRWEACRSCARWWGRMASRSSRSSWT
jgi:ABC-type multidrug transport system ATPase subunit